MPANFTSAAVAAGITSYVLPVEPTRLLRLVAVSADAVLSTAKSAAAGALCPLREERASTST